MVRVLFVCLGNICRSPMAEAVMRHLVEEAGLSKEIQVDSVGTAGWHAGNPPHQGTIDKLALMKISSEGIYSRQLVGEDIEKSDYIIAMDDTNTADLQEFIVAGNLVLKGKVCKLTDYLTDAKINYVPDPYYTGDFNFTYELVDECCRNLLTQIKNNMMDV